MERAIADQLETLHPDAFGWALHAVWTAFLLWMFTRGFMLSLAFEKEFGPRSVLRRPPPK